MHFKSKWCTLRMKKEMEKNYLEYNPIDYSFGDIAILTTWNLHDNLPKSIRRYDNFHYALQEKAFFCSLACSSFCSLIGFFVYSSLHLLKGKNQRSGYKILDMLAVHI